CGIAAVIGVVVAFSIPKEYEVKVTLAPEISNKGGGISGSMGALASMAGINLGSMAGGEDAISPELYPNIVGSIPFLVELFKVNVVTKKGDLNTSLYDYMDKHQRSTWWSYILAIPSEALSWTMSLFKEKEPKGSASDPVDAFCLTSDQAGIAKSLKKSITSSVDKKTGVITLVVTMQDPLIAAALADTVQSKLQQYITDYRTSKSRKDLIFTEKLYKEAKKKYYQAQQTYAAYSDGNMNVVMARYRTEEERLKDEMTLAYSVYNQVSQQLQMAKAKVQEITPVYTVVQPASVPLLASKPKKAIILIGFVFLAAFGTIAWILLKDMMKEWTMKK
ncbi:MAG: chain-length determining protein, partial [Bacteroidaceae bacterium]